MILPVFPNFVGIMLPPGDCCYKYFRLPEIKSVMRVASIFGIPLTANSLQSTPTKTPHSVFNVNFHVISLFKRILEPNSTF